MELVEYTDKGALFTGLAAIVAGELDAGIAAHGRATLVVPGGSTPGPMFDALCHADIPWSQVAVMLSDERWVDEHSERSNSALIKRRLLQNRAAAAQFVPFYRAGADAYQGVAVTATDVAQHLPITSLVLGMGADMHTASLFPGSPELPMGLAPDAPALIAVDPGNGLEMRVTLTAPVLQGAGNTHVLIVGDDKRAALAQATALGPNKLGPDQAPIQIVLDQATVHWAP